MFLSHHLEINSTLSMAVKGKQTNAKIPTILAFKRGWIPSCIFHPDLNDLVSIGCDTSYVNHIASSLIFATRLDPSN